jgi:hypothetical protein
MKVRVGHAFPAGDVAHAGATKARRAYYTNQALAQVCDPLHTPTHEMLPTWEEGDLIVDPQPQFRLPIVGPLSPGSLRVRAKADVVLPVPRVGAAFEDLRFDTADDLETLDDFDFDIDEGGEGGTGDER